MLTKKFFTTNLFLCLLLVLCLAGISSAKKNREKRSATESERGYCEIWGDSQYVTFDNLRYYFYGDCDYTILTPCTPQNEGAVDFHLWEDNIKVASSSWVSKLRKVYLDYNGKRFSIGQRHEIYVGEEKRIPPVYDADTGVFITYNHPLTTLNTDFGLTLTYDGSDTVNVWIWAGYWGNTCGLCGTFNGDKSDEYRLKNGSLAKNLNEFGYSWAVNTENCESDSGESEDPLEGDAR